ncbi:MAG: hypothetical protein M1817_003355 [Caeruleum heppii]|nr:MAG: hypothetical protein M1817_003355 [Caeruleum heppii]
MSLPPDPHDDRSSPSSPPLDPDPPRLSIPFHFLLPASTSVSFLTGMALGMSQGSITAGLRFRAENAHRLPQTPTGWYFYHKSKNYHRMLGGVKEGFRMGFRMGFWGGALFTVQEAVDRIRGTKDFASTVVAGLGVAGGFSLWNRFPIPTAARTAKSGLKFGLVFGLVQDVLALARGRRLGYVDFLLRRDRRALTTDGQAVT